MNDHPPPLFCPICGQYMGAYVSVVQFHVATDHPRSLIPPIHDILDYDPKFRQAERFRYLSEALQARPQ